MKIKFEEETFTRLIQTGESASSNLTHPTYRPPPPLDKVARPKLLGACPFQRGANSFPRFQTPPHPPPTRPPHCMDLAPPPPSPRERVGSADPCIGPGNTSPLLFCHLYKVPVLNFFGLDTSGGQFACVTGKWAPRRGWMKEAAQHGRRRSCPSTAKF